MPKKAKQDLWGEDVDLNELNLDELINEAIEKGESEIMPNCLYNHAINILLQQLYSFIFSKLYITLNFML